jgi:FMN phosphatase YigB (HAD superfamily)
MKTNLDAVVSSFKNKSKKHIVGVDIDNTLFHIPVIEYVNKKYGTKYTNDDVTSWSFSNFPELIRRDILEQFLNPNFMCTIKPDWGTYGKLRDWHAEGIRLFAVTRRASILGQATWTQLNKEFPNVFEDMFIVRPQESKASVLKYLGCTVHIDDWDVEDSIKAGIQTWLIANERTQYNKELRTNTSLNQALELKYVNLDRDKWIS